MRRLLAVLLLVALVACEPERQAPPPRFGSDACNHSLPGSQILHDIDADGIPIVCEPRLPDAPAWAIGWYDVNGTGIHIWPSTIPINDHYTRNVAAHEYGHAVARRHPDWLPYWQQVRGLTVVASASEDFADSWSWCVYPRPNGVGWRFYAGVPDVAQCAVLRDWYPSR